MSSNYQSCSRRFWRSFDLWPSLTTTKPSPRSRWNSIRKKNMTATWANSSYSVSVSRRRRTILSWRWEREKQADTKESSNWITFRWAALPPHSFVPCCSSSLRRFLVDSSIQSVRMNGFIDSAGRCSIDLRLCIYGTWGESVFHFVTIDNGLLQ